jgi:hypothetical protein
MPRLQAVDIDGFESLLCLQSVHRRLCRRTQRNHHNGQENGRHGRNT